MTIIFSNCYLMKNFEGYWYELSLNKIILEIFQQTVHT